MYKLEASLQSTESAPHTVQLDVIDEEALNESYVDSSIKMEDLVVDQEIVHLDSSPQETVHVDIEPSTSPDLLELIDSSSFVSVTNSSRNSIVESPIIADRSLPQVPPMPIHPIARTNRITPSDVLDMTPKNKAHQRSNRIIPDGL